MFTAWLGSLVMSFCDENQPMTVMKKMFIQRLALGSRLREAPHEGDIAESEPKRGIPSCSLRLAYSFSIHVETLPPGGI